MSTFFSRNALDDDSDDETIEQHEQANNRQGNDSNIILGCTLMAIGAALLVYFFPNTLYAFNTSDDTHANPNHGPLF